MVDLWGLTSALAIVNAGTLPVANTGAADGASNYCIVSLGGTAYLFCVNIDNTTLEAYSLTNTNPAVAALVDSEVFTILGDAGNHAPSAVAIGSTAYVMVGNWDFGSNESFKGKIYSFTVAGGFGAALTALPGTAPGAVVGTDGTDLYVSTVSNGVTPSDAAIYRYNAGTWDEILGATDLHDWRVCGAVTVGSECVFVGSYENEAASGIGFAAIKVSGVTATSLGQGTNFGDTSAVDPVSYFVTGPASLGGKAYCIFHSTVLAIDRVLEVDPATAYTAIEDFTQSVAGTIMVNNLFAYDGSLYAPLRLAGAAGVSLFKSPSTITDPWTSVATHADDDLLTTMGLVF